jgi:hypothetical protein
MGNEVLRDGIVDYMENNPGTDLAHLKHSVTLVTFIFVNKTLIADSTKIIY